MPCRVRRVGADGRMTKGAAGRGGAGGGQSLVKSRMAKAGGGVKAKAAGGLVQAGGGGASAKLWRFSSASRDSAERPLPAFQWDSAERPGPEYLRGAEGLEQAGACWR